MGGCTSKQSGRSSEPWFPALPKAPTAGEMSAVALVEEQELMMEVSRHRWEES